MVMRTEGQQAQLLPLNQVRPEDIELAEKIIVGAAIRYGKHNREVYDFAEQYAALLVNKKSAFFSVNVVARKPEKNTPKTNPYVVKFIDSVNWQPCKLGVFAGKIDYPNYRFFDRLMIRFIMWLTKGPTDTRGVFEFTDWEKVDGFGKSLVRL